VLAEGMTEPRPWLLHDRWMVLVRARLRLRDGEHRLWCASAEAADGHDQVTGRRADV
jgi:hypothetical protein